MPIGRFHQQGHAEIFHQSTFELMTDEVYNSYEERDLESVKVWQLCGMSEVSSKQM
jgi:hypothetical protein